MKTCSVEGCENRIWSKGLCLNHIKRKPLPASRQLGITTKVKAFVDKEKINKMRAFFMEIWNKRKHYSEVSGTFLGSEPLTIFFHHILPKEKFPQAKLDEDNIILLTFDEHNNVENDMYKYEEVNERRKHLKIKYERA